MIDRLIVNYPVGSNFLGFMTSWMKHLLDCKK
jgi:hypothetical protein